MRKTMIVLGVAMLGLVGCSSSTASGPSAPPPVTPPAAASPEKVVLENFVGANLADVEHALGQLDLKHSAESQDGKKILAPSNWTVTGQDPAAGTEVKTGSTVKLTAAQSASAPASPGQ